ncbi:hypothetical protein BaRGS_00005321 [Batillaria attramentaria]|uniref:LAGLIDADG homing endonuclease n=1 Tax=Batillaria attramentaria TaxID=370345 RepID=A0ABD0LW70_9CAEN
MSEKNLTRVCFLYGLQNLVHPTSTKLVRNDMLGWWVGSAVPTVGTTGMERALRAKMARSVNIGSTYNDEMFRKVMLVIQHHRSIWQMISTGNRKTNCYLIWNMSQFGTLHSPRDVRNTIVESVLLVPLEYTDTLLQFLVDLLSTPSLV